MAEIDSVVDKIFLFFWGWRIDPSSKLPTRGNECVSPNQVFHLLPYLTREILPIAILSLA